MSEAVATVPVSATPLPPSQGEGAGWLRLRGVRQNNLRGFDLDLPLGRLIAVTGLSGAGKSSLVFDTLHAEGQRRYVETFSPYTRQFLERLERPQVDAVENIRPSIAIQQTNTVKTSRSTVGTMTELTDFCKVWFANHAQLVDPTTGQVIVDHHPRTIWRQACRQHGGQPVLLAFPVRKPDNFAWAELIERLQGQGYSRAVGPLGAIPLGQWQPPAAAGAETELLVVQDRLPLPASPDGVEAATAEPRFLEAAATALRFGAGDLRLHAADGRALARFREGLVSPATGRRFRPATAALFSFNSPIGACPRCKGFGRVIEIDPRLVVPDTTLSLREGAIRAFTGQVYSQSQEDLLKACKRERVRTNVAWRELSEAERAFIWDGEADYGQPGRAWPNAWYGVKRFFEWLESSTYKMHVRVFLAKFRAYRACPDCGGGRLQPEALCWQWQGHTLPSLYALPISQLRALFATHGGTTTATAPERDLALLAIRQRLTFLDELGLGYLTLDRASRTLSGGEAMRVSLTTCLGTGLVETLFILDEPSIGLHARDTHRLIGILRRLVDQGNTVVVVEHDEAILRAADWLVEIGPGPGAAGGRLVYNGPASGLYGHPASLTGAYLSGRATIAPPTQRRPVDPAKKGDGWLTITGARCHNLKGIDVRLPKRRLVCLSGPSGSGKSTLLDNVLAQSLLAARGQAVEEPAEIGQLTGAEGLAEIVLVDQSPVSRTPRSNAALFAGIWDIIRMQFALTDEAKAAGFTEASFSFNSGDGRCPHCEGLGYERVEMQFMADVYIPCPICNGRRFLPSVRAIRWRGKSVDEFLELSVDEARALCQDLPGARIPLAALGEVGLGYLPLGQPLNTLSGGEAQRLKLVKYLSRYGDKAEPSLLLLDEPTTGLHRDDVKRLLAVLHALVEAGHSLVVIEHHLDVLAQADWLIEMGPEGGQAGGQMVAEGPPEVIAAAECATAPWLQETLLSGAGRSATVGQTATLVAEPMVPATAMLGGPRALTIAGAREHNLQNLALSLPLGEFTVLTGVSGSGKSTLAFDIIFAEGQRRFMESMSAWARQFVEQMPRPEVDHLSCLPPTVAIAQRVTAGTRKSTVATITEVAQYLRLLYARAGLIHSLTTGEPVVGQSSAALLVRLQETLAKAKPATLYFCAPIVRGRKGHQGPLAAWAEARGYEFLRCDGELRPTEKFEKLDRFREHDVELVVATLRRKDGVWLRGKEPADLPGLLGEALNHGKGACFLVEATGEPLAWFSTAQTDPATGEAFPELDPKHFSWNSARGWCPTCRGHGHIIPGLQKTDEEREAGEAERDEPMEETAAEASAQPCPECGGTRLNRLARQVRLPLRDGRKPNLPELLALPPHEVLATLDQRALDARGEAVAQAVLPEIRQRLQFLAEVGLDYLALDRATATLSGGEAQRIRLAAQLGSNLAGVLYVLDEPSIGLHPRDNDRLIGTLRQLRTKGNSLLVVEHDEDTMRAADRLIDLGPGAGRHGGQIVAQGTWQQVAAHPKSLTGKYLRTALVHPLRGAWRPLAAAPKPRKTGPWLVLDEPRLRNLKGGRLTLPLQRLTVVCGPSGAGKSTLLRDLLRPALEALLAVGAEKLSGKALAASRPGDFPAGPPAKELRLGETLRRVVEVDQSPIGHTPRSTPATYIGAYDIIRDLFAQLPEAQVRGLPASAFSFNTKGGRCETCKGAGRVKLEMSFMPETWVECPDCGGERFGRDMRELRWNGKHIAEVLQMPFSEAAEFFSFQPRLKALLELMTECGLGYLTLGQSSPTLSGGEAQRLKLVSELATGLPTAMERSRGLSPKNFYLLEEPTIGLHPSDVERLLHLLHRLVEQGHTVVVIEHHLDVIAEADWVVEVGPGGGEAGGQLLYQGPVPGLADMVNSPTGGYLRARLQAGAAVDKG